MPRTSLISTVFLITTALNFHSLGFRYLERYGFLTFFNFSDYGKYLCASARFGQGLFPYIGSLSIVLNGVGWLGQSFPCVLRSQTLSSSLYEGMFDLVQGTHLVLGRSIRHTQDITSCDVSFFLLKGIRQHPVLRNQNLNIVWVLGSSHGIINKYCALAILMSMLLLVLNSIDMCQWSLQNPVILRLDRGFEVIRLYALRYSGINKTIWRVFLPCFLFVEAMLRLTHCLLLKGRLFD